MLDEALNPGDEYHLPDAARHHLINVLRLRIGDHVAAFNGRDGREAMLEVLDIDRRNARVRVLRVEPVARESALRTTLVQAVCGSDRMDYALQKAVELGVSAIQPIYTQRGHPPFSGNRLAKRCQHWASVAIGACEQSGRVIVPTLAEPIAFLDYLALPSVDTRIMLDPAATQGIKSIQLDAHGVSLWVGPEGGWTRDELDAAGTHGVTPVRFGPRVLRCETAGPALLAWCQSQAGDLVE